jgi:hypothetical protein
LGQALRGAEAGGAAPGKILREPDLRGQNSDWGL